MIMLPLHKNWIILLFLILPVNLMGQNQAKLDSFKLGNTYYTQENYEDAIRVWEWILNQGYESPELYYNLGNAYFKSHQITYAILNYERAKLLDPGNEDIDYNLELAQSFVVDKIEQVPGLFISEWHKGLVNLFSSNIWATIGLISFLFMLIFLSFFLYTQSYGIKKLSFWLLVLWLYVSISANFFAYHHHKQVVKPGTALVLSPSVTVESSPDESGTDLFLIHEGTKVKIKEYLGKWTRVKLSDGKEGWVQTSQLIKI